MNEHVFYRVFLSAWCALGGLVFVLLFFVTAPYGRHERNRWGATVRSRLGWILMEAPSSLAMLLWFAIGNRTNNVVAIIFLCMWQFHYLHRSFVFPFGKKQSVHRMPVVVLLMAFVHNMANAYLNGRYLFTFSRLLDADWLITLRFLSGAALFVTGIFINVSSDRILFALRTEPSADYRVPYGGLYRWISCPNYLGEMIEWLGWAIATWSPAGLVFFAWTVANLAPRARSNHLWYCQNFSDYPKNRKALIPHVF